MLTIEEVSSGAELEEVRSLFREYADSLGVDLCFQGFDQELRTLPGEYLRPKGRLLLARWKNQVAGCVALREIGPGVCEMKRLYLRPAYRSLGIGRTLALRCVSEASTAGYQSMRLDSLPSMTSALTLYRELGFQEIPPYRNNPVEGAVFLELQLGTSPVDA